ncbi:MAG: DUF5522 domain-containing protein [Acidobacteriaceae bacterium]
MPADNAPLIEGVDYYLENGYFVFTELYLLKRGTCCESGCRHCPYGFGPEGLKRKLARKQQPG